MSKEAVLKVKEAELRATTIVEDAHGKAAKMVNDAENSVAKSCLEFEHQVKADYRSRIDEVRKNAQELIDKNNADDEKKYAVYEQIAQTHMNEAVRLIVQGVISECQ
ncbi:MAG: hypothetical protein E7667_06090 [Ruminococcaceae bacterium]|nr:hypothetical protein [Oscillospiraceae bacterium]